MLGFSNPVHLIFLFVVLLLVFGAKRLPEMGRSLGSGMRGFKDSLNGEATQPAALQQQQAAPAHSQTVATTEPSIVHAAANVPTGANEPGPPRP
jgi:sec-independent protein translocase protein TatA